MNIKRLLQYLKLLSILAAGIYFVEVRYTLATEFKKLVQRFDTKQLKDEKYDLMRNRRYWKKQLKSDPEDIDAKEELELIEEQLNDTKKQLDILLNKEV